MTECKVCNKARVSASDSSQERSSALLNWLCQETCIKWFESWTGDPTPDCSDGQYGVMYIRENMYVQSARSKERLQSTTMVDVDGFPVEKDCLTVTTSRRLSVELRVYGDSGIRHNCNNEEVIDDKPHRTAEDVLIYIHALSYKENEITDLNFKFVRESQDFNVMTEETNFEDGRICPQNKIMLMTLSYCSTTSVCIDGTILGHCVFNCEGEPLCLPKPTC